jgi:hypothetical protein
VKTRAAVVSALLALSCGANAPERAPPRIYPGELRAPSAYPGAFMLRWQVTALYGEKRVTFDAVLQKRADELTLLGLTPYGSRAFLVRQNGAVVSFENYLSEELPFPPRYILLDVHRTMLGGISETGAALPDGVHSAPRGDEVVRERWTGGRLVERVFRRASNDPPGEITITYEGGMIPGREAPRRIVFKNGWFGYRLEIAIQR